MSRFFYIVRYLLRVCWPWASPTPVVWVQECSSLSLEQGARENPELTHIVLAESLNSLPLGTPPQLVRDISQRQSWLQGPWDGGVQGPERRKQGVKQDYSPEFQDNKPFKLLRDCSAWRREGSVVILAMCMNTWWEGMKMSELDSSQQCLLTGEAVMGRN